ncbi:MAG: GNAT family N-acetyltransferase [Hyphomonadaceae bacterium]
MFQSFRDIVGVEIAAIAFRSAETEQASFLDQIAGPDSAHELWVGDMNGAIVGFVSLKVDSESGVGELDLNAVHPDHANKGVGAQLHAHAKALGAKVATVGVGGDASHAPARRAYEKAGFGPAIPSLWYYRTL